MNFLQDVRFAGRTLLKAPIFSVVAVLSLALGIGANTAIFSMLDQVLLRLLPVKHPEQLVLLDQKGANQGSMSNDHAFSYPMYVDFRDKSPVFSGVLARYGLSFTMSRDGQTERVRGELISGNYFEVLGVSTILGRPFSQDDDKIPGGHPLAILSYGFWQQRFASGKNVLGSKILINGNPMTIIGVSAPGFKGTETGRVIDVFLPMMMKAQATPTWNELDNRRNMWLNVIARLKPGVTAAQAQAGMAVLYRQILEEELKGIASDSKRFRDRFVSKPLRLLPAATGMSQLQEQFSAPLIVLMGMVGLVLLIACANVANLLMARAAARQKEVAIRLALGASRGQIVRQLLIESGILGLVGGAVGLLVASWAGDALIAFLPFPDAMGAFSSHPDVRVLAFNFSLAIVTGVVFGLVPALQSTRPALAPTLKDQAGNISGGLGHVRFRKGLVVAQVALSLLLLVGAGLFARSLYNLKSLNPGFRTDHLLEFSLEPSLNGYSQERIQALFVQLQDNIGNLGGVRGVSMAEVGPLSGDMNLSTVRVEGYKPREDEDMNPYTNFVAPKFFSTIGVPVIAGRDFRESDKLGAAKVCILNETMARRFFGGENPIGKHVAAQPSRGPMDIEIIGVVADGKMQSLREKVPISVYFPYMQDKSLTSMNFYVRTQQEPGQAGNSVRAEVGRIDGNLPVFNMKTMEDQVDEALLVERIIASLSAFFGLLATVLASIGLYGVMAYSVARRTREIGIRMALGAEQGNVVWLVLKEVAFMTAIGIVIGLPASYVLGRLVESQLFGLAPYDPFTLVGATGILIVIALLAGGIPARRATRIDPMIALRYE